MDPQRFEAFSRALATGPSRRGVLKGIVGAIDPDIRLEFDYISGR